MNARERKIQYYLLTLQGLYYIILGILSLITKGYEILIFPVNREVNLLSDGLILVIGLALILSRKIPGNDFSISILGVLSNLTLFIFQFYLTIFVTPTLFNGVDLLVQSFILLVWTYLFYWKWMEGEFAGMRRINRKKKNRQPL